MDYFFDPNRLPSFLVPFVTLSYPVDRPLKPDSFPDSSYYDIGYRDACVIVTLIAIMAILRDASRLFILEPFANWKLTRDWRRRRARKSGSSTPDSKPGSNNTVGHNGNSKTNGPVAIHSSAEKPIADRPPENSREARQIRHAVMRFAEQGWQAIFYMAQWSLGIVRFSYLSFFFGNPKLICAGTVPLLSPSLQSLGRIPSHTACWYRQAVLLDADIAICSCCASPQRRGRTQRSLANDDPPRCHHLSDRRELLLRFHARWMFDHGNHGLV